MRAISPLSSFKPTRKCETKPGKFMKNSNPALPTSQAQFVNDEKFLIENVDSLKPGARRLLDTLCFYDGNFQAVFPGQRRLAKNGGMNIRTIRRKTRELQEAGLVQVVSHPDIKSLLYMVNPLLRKQSIRDRLKRYIKSFAFFPLVFLMSTAHCWTPDSGESPLHFVGRRAIYTQSALKNNIPAYVCKNDECCREKNDKLKYALLRKNDIYKTTLRSRSSRRASYRSKRDINWKERHEFYKGMDEATLNRRKIMEEEKTQEALKRAFGTRSSNEGEKWRRRVASDEQVRANLAKLGLPADFNPFKHESEEHSQTNEHEKGKNGTKLGPPAAEDDDSQWGTSLRSSVFAKASTDRSSFDGQEGFWEEEQLE